MGCKQMAEESVKTKKAREKLSKRLGLMEKKVTQQALREKLAEIHRWISVNAAHRVVLQTKSIALFDGNQNTADVSKKIVVLMEQIQQEYLPVEAHKAEALLKRLLLQSRVEEKATIH